MSITPNTEHSQELVKKCHGMLEAVVDLLNGDNTIEQAEEILIDVINQLHKARFSLPGMTYSQATEIINDNLQELQSMSSNQMPDIDRIIPLVSESSRAMEFMQSRIDHVNAYLTDNP